MKLNVFTNVLSYYDKEDDKKLQDVISYANKLAMETKSKGGFVNLDTMVLAAVYNDIESNSNKSIDEVTIELLNKHFDEYDLKEMTILKDVYYKNEIDILQSVSRVNIAI